MRRYAAISTFGSAVGAAVLCAGLFERTAWAEDVRVRGGLEIDNAVYAVTSGPGLGATGWAVGLGGSLGVQLGSVLHTEIRAVPFIGHCFSRCGTTIGVLDALVVGVTLRDRVELSLGPSYGFASALDPDRKSAFGLTLPVGVGGPGATGRVALIALGAIEDRRRRGLVVSVSGLAAADEKTGGALGLLMLGVGGLWY